MNGLDERNREAVGDFEWNMMCTASRLTFAYLVAAVDNVEACFGKGYAREHPEIISAFLQAAAALRSRSHNGG